MNIDHLILSARDLNSQRDFYAGTLGLKVTEDTSGRLTLLVGRSLLTFRHDPAHTAFSHFALDIPRTLVDGAQAWLEARVPLLTDKQRHARFELDAAWNSTSFYFADPAGNIVEFIARRDLPHGHAGPFAPEHALYVSEYGLVVDSVPDAVRWLGEAHHVHPFVGQSNTFTAVGSPGGMFIVVPAGRGWRPTGQPAVPAPFEARLTVSRRPQTLHSASLTVPQSAPGSPGSDA